MGLFGKGKNRAFDTQKSDANREKMRRIFDGAVEDAVDDPLIDAHNEDVKSMNDVIARKVTYTYKRIVVGYRERDMRIVLVDTTPTLDAHGEVRSDVPQDLKKAKIHAMTKAYTLYRKEGMMAGFEAFERMDVYENEELFAYMDQTQEVAAWNACWKRLCQAV